MKGSIASGNEGRRDRHSDHCSPVMEIALAAAGDFGYLDVRFDLVETHNL
jgi:hypothetical protein